MPAPFSATAIAHPNIALVKYWGKRAGAGNLPAVGSLSVTLDAMRSRTTVRFEPGREADEVRLNGRHDPEAARRVTACLDLLRSRAGVAHGAVVTSDNDFPTGAGLASSASGFAALATAAAAALHLNLPPAALADIARVGSGSAPRSLYGGFAVMRNATGGGVAVQGLLEQEAWPLRVIIAVASDAAKAVSSRDGMVQSRDTSPFYGSWVQGHDADLDAAEHCVRRQDFAALGEIAEASCLKMHAVMMTTRPPLLYWAPATLAAIHAVWALRRAGTPVFFTIDAGPQLKAVCLPAAAGTVRAALGAVPGVERVLDSGLGAGARLADD